MFFVFKRKTNNQHLLMFFVFKHSVRMRTLFDLSQSATILYGTSGPLDLFGCCGMLSRQSKAITKIVCVSYFVYSFRNIPHTTIWTVTESCNRLAPGTTHHHWCIYDLYSKKDKVLHTVATLGSCTTVSIILARD